MLLIRAQTLADRLSGQSKVRQIERITVPADGDRDRSAFDYVWENYASPLGKALASRSRVEIEVGCALLMVLVGISEYLDKLRLSMVLLYAIPIAIAAWYAGRRSALALAVLGMPIWFTAILMKGDAQNLMAFGLNRALIFGLLAVIVAHIRDLHDNLEALADRRALALVSEMAERERLEREMLEISEREQRRIGQDLHDGLCQFLTGTAMITHVHARKLTKADESETARRIVDKIEQAIGLARGIAKGLDPVQTQSDGLMQALEEFSSTTSDLFGVRCRFECDLPVLLDAPATAAHIFRIAQEAVCNAIKHGKAKEIDISLEHTEQGLQLCVSDNGRGLPNGASCQNGGMGLRTMAIRAKLIGGQFVVRPNALGGVEVFCSVPENADAG
jgi:signal transduction histidine kinase